MYVRAGGVGALRAAKTDLERRGWQWAARAPVLVEDGPAKATQFGGLGLAINRRWYPARRHSGC